MLFQTTTDHWTPTQRRAHLYAAAILQTGSECAVLGRSNVEVEESPEKWDRGDAVVAAAPEDGPEDRRTPWLLRMFNVMEAGLLPIRFLLAHLTAAPLKNKVNAPSDHQARLTHEISQMFQQLTLPFPLSGGQGEGEPPQRLSGLDCLSTNRLD